MPKARRRARCSPRNEEGLEWRYRLRKCERNSPDRAPVQIVREILGCARKTELIRQIRCPVYYLKKQSSPRHQWHRHPDHDCIVLQAPALDSLVEAGSLPVDS